MKERRFDHIDLRVKQIGPAKRFYARLLPELGFTAEAGGKNWLIWKAPGKGPVEFFGFTEAKEHRPNDNRIAFWAETREQVDRLAEVVRGRRFEPRRTDVMPRILARVLRGLL